MARANLNNSKKVLTSITTASKYLGGPESVSFEIPPFRPHFIKLSKSVSYEVCKSCVTMFTFRGTFIK